MKVLILGATSDMAQSLAARFADRENAELILASRNRDSLNRIAKDLEIRFNVTVTTARFDGMDFSGHRAFWEGLGDTPDGVILAFGLLGDQEKSQQDFERAREVIETNFLAAVSILEIAADAFEKKGNGFIIGISSVSGERGRKSNYIYGSAKAGLTAYLSGLRHRLAEKDIHVLTVLPGFVDTRMTESMDLPEKLTASPDQAADDIFRAWKKKRNIVYTRWFWRWIMLIITSIPEPVFKKTNL